MLKAPSGNCLDSRKFYPISKTKLFKNSSAAKMFSQLYPTRRLWRLEIRIWAFKNANHYFRIAPNLHISLRTFLLISRAKKRLSEERCSPKHGGKTTCWSGELLSQISLLKRSKSSSAVGFFRLFSIAEILSSWVLTEAQLRSLA